MSSYQKIVGGKLNLKGGMRLKKKRKAEDSTSSSTQANNSEDRTRGDEGEGHHDEIVILNGTGRLTSSGTTIQGHSTNFIEEISPGDAIIVFHPTTLHEETKIVRMVLSPVSLGISSAFSTDLISTTPFKYIKAPKEELDEEAKLKVQRTVKEKQNDLERAAFGTYASNGGQKIVYRVKKASAYGGYKIIEEDSNGTLSREELLERRSKKKSDRLC